MACSGFLTSPFVNNDYVTAELICSAAHACHKVLAWSRVVCCVDTSSTQKVVALLPHHGCVCWVSRKRREYSMSTTKAAASSRRASCYSYCDCQERVDMSAVPNAPHVFFQPPSSHFAYPGFREQCGQCGQQDNWHQEQDQRYSDQINIVCYIYTTKCHSAIKGNKLLIHTAHQMNLKIIMLHERNETQDYIKDFR